MKILLSLILFIQICFMQSCLTYSNPRNKCENLDNQRTQVLLYCKDSIQKQEMLIVIDSIMAIKCVEYLKYKRYLEDLENMRKQ